MFGQTHDETKKLWCFEESTKLSEVTHTMSANHIHYAIVEAEDHSFRLLSQYDLVQFLLASENKEELKFAQKSLQELGLINPAGSPVRVSVESTQTALYAFRLMELTSHSSVPLVDPNTKGVISTMSASHLREIDTENLDLVMKPATRFLESIHALEPPVTCRESATVIEVLEKLVANNHRHMWVVDEKFQFVASVSFSDILKLVA